MIEKKPVVCEFASPEMVGFKNVVIVAVRLNGSFLGYASPELLDDEDFVMAAIKNDGNALQHSSDILKDEKKVDAAALKKIMSCFSIRVS